MYYSLSVCIIDVQVFLYALFEVINISFISALLPNHYIVLVGLSLAWPWAKPRKGLIFLVFVATFCDSYFLNPAFILIYKL